MRILILDDDHERHDWCRDGFAEWERQHVWTAEQAAWALRDPDGWDIVTLDHDLDRSHRHAYDEREHSGLVVALAIAKSVLSLRWAADCRFIIHSWNPDGARSMYDAIAGVGLDVSYEPFRWSDDRDWCRKWYGRAWPNPAERPPLPWERDR